ncbi:MAG: thiamine phosphate synthase, partial [Deltaproteobacteria bacterium]
NLQALLAAACPGSVQVLLRDRQLPIRERRELGERLRRTTRAHGHSLSVSDRLDLAWLLDADAVHLGEDSVVASDARAFGVAHGRSWWISTACHSPEAIASLTADAALLSPVVAPRKGNPALGLDGLARAVLARQRRDAAFGGCALYALGGVTRHDAAELLAAGADVVALIGELFVPGAGLELLAALGILERPTKLTREPLR